MAVQNDGMVQFYVDLYNENDKKAWQAQSAQLQRAQNESSKNFWSMLAGGATLLATGNPLAAWGVATGTDLALDAKYDKDLEFLDPNDFKFNRSEITEFNKSLLIEGRFGNALKNIGSKLKDLFSKIVEKIKNFITGICKKGFNVILETFGLEIASATIKGL